MADNTDEEHLDNPTNTQSENSPDEVNPTTDIETINSNQVTENMEVHHHAHHEGKKSWKSYLWEFLMLFLAVFCGFLAEYQLEHVIEHNREKEFMWSMIDDLKTDTASLAYTLDRVNRNQIRIDSAIKFYAIQKNPTTSQVTAIGMYSDFGLISHGVVFTDRTSLQLKNSGGMRLIRNKLVADSLIAYWSGIQRIENDFIRIESYRLDAKKLGFKIFNYYASSYVHDYLDSTVSVESSTLLDNSPKLFGEFINSLETIGGMYRRLYTVKIKRQISSAERLIELIKKEYNLE